MRQINKIHDSEDERQPRGHQEQSSAELQAIEKLDCKQRPVHPRSSPLAIMPLTSSRIVTQSCRPPRRATDAAPDAEA